MIFSTVAVLVGIASSVFMSLNIWFSKHHSSALIVVYVASWASRRRFLIVSVLL